MTSLIPMVASVSESNCRPRAATLSMCRYMVPLSPARKPSIAPANSPPSLILPPPGPNKYVSRRRYSEDFHPNPERLASSAPSGIAILVGDHERTRETVTFPPPSSSIEFSLLEDESPHNLITHQEGLQSFRINRNSFFGYDDQDDESPVMSFDVVDGSSSDTLCASPVLISCLREIANMPKTLQ